MRQQAEPACHPLGFRQIYRLLVLRGPGKQLSPSARAQAKGIYGRVTDVSAQTGTGVDAPQMTERVQAYCPSLLP
ncbi:hypothetical protein AA0313_2405 [Acetobacter indonesiensis NRIC 0313]|uniref:Uncharacterized protein n=1 Tax=Acetobacter indonesiensis TaxID=104101 RepID=A0A6N3SZ86_9PROT|nr:hypothetical protein Abin_006_243 [Acetobacter indonesiensis]GBQ60449.1 hypothetical protein AA0313_2405 [Acetobacter indonesiensis NRIC 0313]GEN02221.1 hypothetical protein AIN02nite_02460 [Acetobacter indonesiensis]